MKAFSSLIVVFVLFFTQKTAAQTLSIEKKDGNITYKLQSTNCVRVTWYTASQSQPHKLKHVRIWTDGTNKPPMELSSTNQNKQTRNIWNAQVHNYKDLVKNPSKFAAKWENVMVEVEAFEHRQKTKGNIASK